MWDVSARFLAGLTGVPRWLTSVEWTADLVNWSPLTLVEGTVTADVNSQVRWTLDMTVVGVQTGSNGLNPYGCRVRVRQGMVHGPGDVEWGGLGVYRVKTVDDTLVDQRVKVTGLSLEQQVINDRFIVPRTIPAGSARQSTLALLREAIPDAALVWQVDDQNLPQIIAERDRWPIIDGDRNATSIARALGARCYTDGLGSFIMAPVPSLEDPPVWTVDSGRGGALLSSGRSLTNDGVFNILVASGASTNGTPPVGPGIAQDLDPSSPTYVNGPFGPCPRFYSSPLLTTKAQCDTAARGMLAPYLGLRQQVTFASVHNPALEVGDVVNVRTRDGLQPVILDQLTYQLVSPKDMTGQTRTTSTRLAGTVTAAPETQESA